MILHPYIDLLVNLDILVAMGSKYVKKTLVEVDKIMYILSYISLTKSIIGEAANNRG